MKPPVMQCENEFCNTVRSAYQNSNAYKRKQGILPQLPDVTPIAADLVEPPQQNVREPGQDDVEFF